MGLSCEPLLGYGFRLDYLIISSLIIGFISLMYLFYMRKHRRDKLRHNKDKLEHLLATFNPEPIVNCNEVSDDTLIVQPNVITRKIGTKIYINNVEYLNFASHNHLNLVDNEKITSEAVKTIHKYGVGSCGPRGFYGTVDVHLDLEQRISEFMHMEEAAVYSYWFSTIASAIPAYCKRGDVVFCDEMISFAAKKGMDAGRCTVVYFKHNDPNDLETKIKAFNKKVAGKKRQPRKFLVLEGIYSNTGVMCNLPPMIELRGKYKMRLFLDESQSIGVLGETGRGIIEHFNIARHEVDMVMGSLEGLIGSIGGFCVGTHFVIEHQRLSGLGYCFSASLPPVLTRAAHTAFDYLDNNKQIIHELREKCAEIQNKLKQLPNCEVSGHEWSPVKYLLFKRNNKIINDAAIYENFAEKCKKMGVIVGTVQNTGNNQYQIKLCINIDFSDDEIKQAFDAFQAAAQQI